VKGISKKYGVLMTDKTKCEVWTGTEWEIQDVSKILPNRNIVLARCYECHGPVVLKSESKDKKYAAHFEHWPKHSGCSLTYPGYEEFHGTKTPHPQAVKNPIELNQRTSGVSLQ
jgi:hypothetical protein